MKINTTKNINIVVNALSARWGGGQTFLFNFLKYSKEFGNLKVYFLADSLPAAAEAYEHVTLIKPTFDLRNIVLRSLWEKYRLPKLLAELKANILFCPGGIITSGKPANCRTVVSFQNMLIFDKASRSKYGIGYSRMRLKILEGISKKSFNDADLLIFISEHAKKVIDEELPLRKGRSVVIPHGLDNSFRTAYMENIPRSGYLPKTDYFLYSSLIERYKSHIEVVRAYDILSRKRKTGEVLLLAGPMSAAYGKQIKKEITKLRLEDKVIFTGRVPHAEMPALYHHARANIFASMCENCPNIVLECLGSGRPLFLSNKEPMPEFGGDAAVYFDPQKPHELADLLLHYVDDDKWAEGMKAKAYERSLNYDWAVTIRKICAEMINLCNGDQK